MGRLLPRRGPRTLYRRLKSLEYLLTRDRGAALDFLFARELPLASRVERARLLRSFLAVTDAVRGYHTLSEMLAISEAILSRAAGGGAGPVVLEAGCGYGASTAKLSLATALAGGTLLACDSFRGIPRNDEKHELLDGRRTAFREGAFRESVTSVRRRVEAWGAPEVCRYVKGWFEETLPSLDVTLDVVVLDVDLKASTRACLRALWPKLRTSGVVFSLDGQLSATHALLAREAFWRKELGTEPPVVEGLGREKLLTIRPRLTWEDSRASARPSGPAASPGPSSRPSRGLPAPSPCPRR